MSVMKIHIEFSSFPQFLKRNIRKNNNQSLKYCDRDNVLSVEMIQYTFSHTFQNENSMQTKKEQENSAKNVNSHLSKIVA